MKLKARAYGRAFRDAAKWTTPAMGSMRMVPAAEVAAKRLIGSGANLAAHAASGGEVDDDVTMPAAAKILIKRAISAAEHYAKSKAVPAEIATASLSGAWK